MMMNHCVIETNLTYCLSLVYFVNQPLHVSDIFVAHHQEVYYIYVCVFVCVCVYIYIYTHSTPPDDVLQICPKHVEVD